jgi:hypothetical protein
MFRKLTLISAIVAALMFPGAAIAKHGGGHHGGGHHGGHHGGGHHGGSHHSGGHHGGGHHARGHYGGGHHGKSHYHGGHHGHYVYHGHGHKPWNRGIYRRGYGWGRWYHGVWWGYGIGSCWSPVPGGWIWVCY